MFDSEEELEHHILAGKHKAIVTRSSYDIVKTIYRQVAASDVQQYRSACYVAANVPGSSAATKFFEVGCALPIRKVDDWIKRPGNLFIKCLKKENAPEKS